ncbi:MAG: 6-bladed beta-propeller, partial [Candidatus Aminicenantes bacterium]|nr:6-bladed beta-propeller [Candidatus Aminicenantes bacterium]
NPKTPSPKDGVKIRIVFEEELSTGVEEGDENYMFGGRVYFNADHEGNIYVTDWDRKRIQKYDPEGKYLLTIGRKGQGPGEFGNVWLPRFDKNNNLYVTDIVNHRIHFFDKKGNFLRHIKTPQGFSCQYVNSKGLIIGTYFKVTEEDKSGEKWVFIFGMFDEKFEPVLEINRRSSESRTSGSRSRAQVLADIWGEDVYKAEISHFMTENELLYFGYPESYEIKIYNPEGKLTKIIQRDYEPIRVSKKHKEKYEKFLEDEFFRLFPRDNAIKEDVFRLIKYPKYLPPYQRFVLMENGWLFVMVDSIPDEYALIDIFDQEGNYIAQFEALIPAENLFFKNGKAYALATENDYRFVKRYRYEIQEYRDNKWVKKK